MPRSRTNKPATKLAAPTPRRVNGVTVARQARSEATYQALIQAGRAAFERGDLESLSVAELARATGTSVGAFYGRFENLDAFLATVQQVAAAEMHARIGSLGAAIEKQPVDLAQFIRDVCVVGVTTYRENQGLYRSVHRLSFQRPQAWEPFRLMGRESAQFIAATVLPRLPHCTEQQVMAAMQFAYGMLNNAVVINPGPLRLDDPDLVDQVCHMLCSFMGIAPHPKSPYQAPPAADAAREPLSNR